MVVPDLYRRIEWTAPVSARGYRVPGHTIDFKFVANQIVRVANYDAISFRVEIDNITRKQRATGQPLSLTDGEKLEAIMFTHKISIEVVNLTSMKFVFAQMRAQERLVIVARHKADFLAISFIGHF